MNRDEWRRSSRSRAVSDQAERRERFVTTSDIEVADLYTPDDLAEAGWDPATALSFPGEYPFTRGVQPTMYRGRFWTMRQYAGFASAAETNRRFRYLLDHGQTGLSVAFDLPTQMGYDADSPAATGEVGRVGVPISSIDEMRVLLDGLPLGEVTTSMTINATAAILLAFYVAIADERGIPRATLGGTLQNDILKEYIARGTYIYPTGASMRLVTDVFEFCARELPRWNTISISGYHMREAGATAAQELAFTLADGIAYVQAARDRGLDVDAFAGRLSFFFAAWSELFEEVAKFRAARRMWARIMRDHFGAREPRSMMCRFHVQTAGSSLTAQSVDPLAGSYFVETLTNQLETAAQQYLDEIDAMGGALAAIEAGYQQRQIQEAAYRVQREIESEERIVVGVNRYRDDTVHTPELQRIDPAGEREQVERLRRLRAERDETAWAAAIARLATAADSGENLVPPIIEAVKARATLGEISDRLRVAWGEHRELITV